MRIVVLAVGKMRDPALASVCAEYWKRARRHLPVDEIEAVDDADLLRRMPSGRGAEVVALEPSGQAWTTEAFTAFVRERMLHGARAVTFLVGGADGLPAAAVARAGRRLSLSPLTLPHRLARVILAEQIYRALSLIKGEPYGR